jgi:hypothetical protein
MQNTSFSCLILIDLQFSRQIPEKYPNIKSDGNMSSGSRVVSCGRTDTRTDGRTDMRKLIVASRNFANSPKKIQTKVYENRIFQLDVLLIIPPI